MDPGAMSGSPLKAARGGEAAKSGVEEVENLGERFRTRSDALEVEITTSGVLRHAARGREGRRVVKARR